MFIQMLNFSALLVPLLVSTGFAPSAQAAPLDYRDAAKLTDLPVKLSQEGKLLAEESDWNKERDQDGTDLLTLKKSKARLAAMKNKNGAVETLVAYSLAEGKQTNEKDVALFFADSRLRALSTCDELSTHKSIGRICVTATPHLCADLRAERPLDSKNLEEAESFETRALSAILTLRGSDHQLDNLAKSGNRLGLKTSLQTTRGQLLILARQIAKETGHASGDKLSAREKEDDANARAVLEHTLPILKSSCNRAGF